MSYNSYQLNIPFLTLTLFILVYVDRLFTFLGIQKPLLHHVKYILKIIGTIQLRAVDESAWSFFAVNADMGNTRCTQEAKLARS